MLVLKKFIEIENLTIDSVKNAVNQNIELLDKSKEELTNLNLDYGNYLSLIKDLKKREEKVDEIIEKFKNPEYEEMEADLLKLNASFRSLRLQLEKEQKEFKNNFLINAKKEIENKIKEIVIDIAELTNHKLKFDYMGFINERIKLYLDTFKGIRVEQYNQQLQSLLNDMQYEQIVNNVLNNIMDDIDATNFLNLGMSFTIDYRLINHFNLKTLIDEKNKEAELIKQKQEEEKERQELLNKKRAEQEQIIQQEQLNQKQAEKQITKQEVIELKEEKKEDKEEIKQEIKQEDNNYIIKDYIFINQEAINAFNTILKNSCDFEVREINGVKRNIIKGVKNV